MPTSSDLPCDGDGVCMVCKHQTLAGETVTCKTCVTPWHAACLTVPPKTLGDEDRWCCPDCTDLSVAEVKSAPVSGGDGLVDKIRAIESDASLTDHEKAKKRQELLSGGGGDAKERNSGGDALGILGDKFSCAICMQLLDRPVSTPCGHNFCLKCFQKWVIEGKKTCAMCRKSIPPKMAMEPRINSAIVMAIRMAKLQSTSSSAAPKVYHVMHNQDRPDKAFTTPRAKKSGKANACSGKIFVSVPLDHFGPITAQNDPTRNRGVLVGDSWEDRMECRQWGAHFPHVAGICGQADCGAQSVALSGGYVDDEDHGDWFLYTGSGGRDLSGNKRTNKLQSFDQTFEKFNEALRVSCKKGYPVRVVRSHKEKRSSYAPQEGVRYDGIYRIEKCWRKLGAAGFNLCRYLFVRCDNDPAPWTSDTHGDIPRSSLPSVAELKGASDITERKGSPAWDYDEQEGRWMWKKPVPESRKNGGDYSLGLDGEYVHIADSGKKKRGRSSMKKTVKERLLKEFSCLICRNVMVEPLTTPCAHNFCKGCLENAFAGQSFTKERTCGGTRTLRTQKNIMKCPSCKSDISEYLRNPQVNRELMDAIESLQNRMEEESLLEDNVGENGEEGEKGEDDSAPEKSTDENSSDSAPEKSTDENSSADENMTAIPAEEEEINEKCNANDGNEKLGLGDEDMKAVEFDEEKENEKEKEKSEVKTEAPRRKRGRSEDEAKVETPRRSKRLKKDEEV